MKANIADRNDLRVVYEDNGSNLMKATWSEDETFTMYRGTSNAGQEFSNSANEKNTFNGKVPAGDGKFYGVYGENISNNGGKLTVDISKQKGTADKNGITEFMVAESADLTSDFKFQHKLTVLKLTLKFPKNETEPINEITVMGLHNKANYSLTDSTFTYEDKPDNITVTNDSKGFAITDQKITAYVAVFPETVLYCAAMIKVETKNGTYIYTLQYGNTLKAGTVVPISVTMPKLEYVDLKLPSGTLWATMNVGANNNMEFGGHYAWGEIEPKSKYTWDNYMCSKIECGTEKDPLYYYVKNKKSIAGTKYDVAHVKWGGNWRMPTREEIQELIDKIDYCCYTYDWYNDYTYATFQTKKTDDWIKLRIYDFYDEDKEDYAHTYYSSSSLGDDSVKVSSLYFRNDPYRNQTFWWLSSNQVRAAEFLVRPVYAVDKVSPEAPTYEEDALMK